MAKIIREIGLEDAKDELVSLVDAAIRNEPSIITRHGKPEAVILSFDEWQRLTQVPSFAQLLMNAPLEPDDLPARDRSGLREIPS